MTLVRMGEHPNVANLGFDTRTVPAAAVEQLVDATELRVETETFRTERECLVTELERERQNTQSERARADDLQKEIKELLRLVGS